MKKLIAALFFPMLTVLYFCIIENPAATEAQTSFTSTSTSTFTSTSLGTFSRTLSFTDAQRVSNVKPVRSLPAISENYVVWSAPAINWDDRQSVDPNINWDDIQTLSVNKSTLNWDDVQGMDITLYDISQKKSAPIVKNTFINEEPHISGNLVVYRSHRTSDGLYLCLYNTSTHQCPEVKIVDGVYGAIFPFVKGPHIVWSQVDVSDGPASIKYCRYDAAHNVCTDYRTIATTYTISSPIVLDDMNTILWDEGNAADTRNIYGAKLSNPGVVYQVLVNNKRKSEIRESGGKVVYSSIDVSSPQLYSYETLEYCVMDTVNMVCLNPTPFANGQNVPMTPDISGDFITYTNNSGDVTINTNQGPQNIKMADVFVYDLAMDKTYQATPFDMDLQRYPSISGHNVAMQTFSYANSSNPLADMAVLQIKEMIPTSNHAPVLSPIGNKQINLGDSIIIPVQATDPDHDPLSYTLTGLPVGGYWDNNTISWKPSVYQAGIYSLTVKVSDGTYVTSETFTITVVDNLPNKIVNGSFEQGKTGWEGFATEKFITSETAWDGLYSLRINAAAGSSKTLDQVITNVSASQFYLTLSYKPNGVSAVYYIEFWDSKGNKLKTLSGTPTNYNGVWQNSRLWELSGIVPAGTTKIKVYVGSSAGSGWVYFDNVILKML